MEAEYADLSIALQGATPFVNMCCKKIAGLQQTDAQSLSFNTKILKENQITAHNLSIHTSNSFMFAWAHILATRKASAIGTNPMKPPRQKLLQLSIVASQTLLKN